MAVADHHRRGARRQAAERREVHALQTLAVELDRRPHAVRVGVGRAEPREVFEAAGDSRALQPVEERTGQARHLAGIATPGAIVDAVAGPGRADVGDRREVEVETQREQQLGRRLAEEPCAGLTPRGELGGRRRCADPRREAAHPAAFLVEGEPDRRIEQAGDPVEQPAGRLDGVEVVAEEDHPSRLEVAEPRGLLGREPHPRKADHQHGAGGAASLVENAGRDHERSSGRVFRRIAGRNRARK